MDKIKPEDQLTTSADIVSENIAQLQSLFPEAFVEGKIDFEVLKQLLGGAVEEREEKYGLNWHGKRAARQLALTPSMGTLRPCPEESVDWETTQNLMIEGDNLEVLKLLQKSYAGKVKLIYIDPPYNTGNDFVYPDKFADSVKNYQLLMELRDYEGNKMSSRIKNSEVSGRFHTDWLNMMYPRLSLCKNLLNNKGVIFVTIDDGEVCNLKMLLDDIFGKENFASSIVWKKRSSPDARDTIGSVHDWILCYVKNKEFIKSAIGKMELSKERIGAYSNPDNDPRGDWASVDMTGMTARATKDQYYPVTLPSGRIVSPPPGRSWGIAKETFDKLSADNRIWFGKDGDNVPRIKRFLGESDGQVVPSFWDMNEVGSNEEAKKEINELMEYPDVFDTPKPLRLINRMIEIGGNDGGKEIVLDFFAGSGTTGNSVLLNNCSNMLDKKFILVQLPEPLFFEIKEQRAAVGFCDKHSLKPTIAELTKERLRRAGKKIREQNPMFAGDTGFRVFKLDSSNIRAWNPDRDNLSQSLMDHIEHILPGRTEADILYEVLLKLGLDLCVPMEKRVFAGKDVHAIGGGVLLACLNTNISRDDVEALGLGIVAWHKELAPAGESTVVFRDNGFADDVAKTNLTAILHQNGLTNVRSL